MKESLPLCTVIRYSRALRSRVVGVAFKSRKWKLFALTYKINNFKKEKKSYKTHFKSWISRFQTKKQIIKKKSELVGWRSENFQMSTKHQFFFQLFTGDQRRRLKWKRFQTCNYKRHEIEKKRVSKHNVWKSQKSLIFNSAS